MTPPGKIHAFTAEYFRGQIPILGSARVFASTFWRCRQNAPTTRKDTDDRKRFAIAGALSSACEARALPKP